MKNSPKLLLILILCLVKSLTWTFMVPVFQTPDEQAHFAQLQWYAEKKNLKIDGQKNLSLEVATVEEILGTRRDERGNNKYTYHPEYKNNSNIPNLPKETRTVYVDQEAALYPPLYYLLDLPFYYLGDLGPPSLRFGEVKEMGNFERRVMVARILSVICHLGLVICAYFIGKIVWEDKFKSLVLAVLVGFHPMISFVSAGIHPDNLLNLIYSAGILVCLLILKNGVKLKYLGWLGGLGWLGLQTKVLMIFFAPVAVATVIVRLGNFGRLGMLGGLGIIMAPAMAFMGQWQIRYMPQVTSQSPLAHMNFWEYLKFRIPKIAFEMWPWYWGVFKWLSATLHPVVMKIITRVAAVCGVGLGIRLLGVVRGFGGFEKKAVIFFLLSAFSYLLYLVMWDFRAMQSMGYSPGLQGRYLFTNIVPQMALLMVGLTIIKRWEKPLLLLLASGMVVLNSIALHTIYFLYY
jgi:hypothetical protein